MNTQKIKKYINININIYIYIYQYWYIYIYDYGDHQLRLKCAQVHHHSPAGTFARVPGSVFVGHRPPWDPGDPPLYEKGFIAQVFYIVSDVTHTYLYNILYKIYIYTYIYTQTHPGVCVCALVKVLWAVKRCFNHRTSDCFLAPGLLHHHICGLWGYHTEERGRTLGLQRCSAKSKVCEKVMYSGQNGGEKT